MPPSCVAFTNLFFQLTLLLKLFCCLERNFWPKIENLEEKRWKCLETQAHARFSVKVNRLASCSVWSSRRQQERSLHLYTSSACKMSYRSFFWTSSLSDTQIPSTFLSQKKKSLRVFVHEVGQHENVAVELHNQGQRSRPGQSCIPLRRGESCRSTKALQQSSIPPSPSYPEPFFNRTQTCSFREL